MFDSYLREVGVVVVKTKTDVSVNTADYAGAAAPYAAAPAVVTADGATPSIRLTVRGKVVLTALLVTLLASVGFGVSNAFAGSAQADTDLKAGVNNFGYIVPLEGDSLWSVAQLLDPNADPRDIVQEIVELNQLSDSALKLYEPIAVPLRYADRPGVQSAAEVGL